MKRCIARPRSPARSHRPAPLACPDSFYKLVVFNLTEYKKVFIFDSDTLATSNTTAAFLSRPPLTISRPQRRMHPHSVNAGMMVLQPDRQLFERMHAMWMRGDYPYRLDTRPPSSEFKFGDEDQTILTELVAQDAFGPVHALPSCQNKFMGAGGRGAEQCRGEDQPLYHKWPASERARVEALWRAAQAGQCRKLSE